jgi:hypothetical protein
VLIGPSTGASSQSLGQGLEDVGQNLLGDGCWELVGRGYWWWRFLGVEGAEGGAHLLCWGQDGLGVEGPGGSRDAANDKAAVDAGGCAVVLRMIGGRWRGGGVSESSSSGESASCRRCSRLRVRRALPLARPSRTRLGRLSRAASEWAA